MAVTVDATASGGSNYLSGESSFTWNHTCHADAGILVVAVCGQSSLDVSGVTYNGVAMTQLVSRGTEEDASIWYLLEPASGTNAVVVSKGSSNAYAGAASISFIGAGAIAQTLSANGTSSPNLTQTNTTAEDAGYTVTALAFNDPSSLTYTGGGTEFVALTRGPGKAQRFVYNAYSGSADEAESWTNSNNRGYDIVGCEVYPGVTTYDVTVTAKARIEVAGNTKTVTAKSRIEVIGNTKTVTAKARVKISGNDKTISARAKIGMVQTQTVQAKADIFNSVDKTVDAKARISQDGNTDTIDAKARILKVQSQEIQTKARLEVTQEKTIQAKARIAILATSVTVTAKARVKQAGVTNTITAMARILKVQTQTIQAKARMWAARLNVKIGRRADGAQSGVRFVRHG